MLLNHCTSNAEGMDRKEGNMSDRILVTRSSMPTLEEYVDEIAPLWESHWLTNMGIEHKKLEGALRERLGVENLALFTNGHNALECVLEAMDLSGKVIKLKDPQILQQFDALDKNKNA